MFPEFSSPSEVYLFTDNLIAQLEAAGFDRAAQPLREVQRTAYATGSEWQGELGQAVLKAIECELPANIQDDLQRILGVVCRIWPDLEATHGRKSER